MEIPKDTTTEKKEFSYASKRGELYTSLDKFSYSNSNHNSNLIQNIIEKQSPDCVIKVRQAEFQVHREIMSLVSNYFEAFLRFDSMTVERSATTATNLIEVKLENMNENSIQLLIDYAYTGTLFLNVMDIGETLKSSEFLLIDTVYDACFKYFTDRLDYNESTIKLLEYAKSSGIQKLINEIITFIVRYFYRFIANKTFIKFSPDLLEEILSSDKLVVMEELPSMDKNQFMFVTAERQEEIVFKWVVEYVKAKKNKNLVKKLILKTVRLGLIPKETFPKLYARVSEVSNPPPSFEFLKKHDKSVVTSHYEISVRNKARDLSDVLMVQWSEPLACQELVGWEELGDFDDSRMVTQDCPVIYITQVTLYKNGHILAGLKIKYSNGTTVQRGKVEIRPASVHTITLRLDERIARVTGTAGSMVDCLTLTTNKRSRFLHFRGRDEDRISIERPCSSAYLAFVKGKIVKHNHDTEIRHLQFGWVYSKDVL